jgi:hypothetical protein
MDIYRDFAITLDKLLRDAIIWRMHVPAKRASVMKFSTKLAPVHHYVMTVLGFEFIAACRGPARF